eukprot:1820542-Rhodomonas_salina.2
MYVIWSLLSAAEQFVPRANCTSASVSALGSVDDVKVSSRSVEVVVNGRGARPPSLMTRGVCSNGDLAGVGSLPANTGRKNVRMSLCGTSSSQAEFTPFPFCPPPMQR